MSSFLQGYTAQVYLAGMKITELDKSERPREKMLELGAAGLSNGELLAILLRTGCGGRNALDLARALLAECGGTLDGLFGSTAERLCGIPGIGPLKASSVLAALELGKRFLEETSSVRREPIITARMVYDLMIPRLKGLQNEECWILLLNNRNYVCGKLRIGQGNLDSTVIDQRRILKTALDKAASSVILIHNHPSGNPTPGPADIKVTEDLKKALNALGLTLTDHVVISEDMFFSFADNRTYSRL